MTASSRSARVGGYRRSWDSSVAPGVFFTSSSMRIRDWADSEERLLALVGEYRAAKILP